MAIPIIIPIIAAGASALGGIFGIGKSKMDNDKAKGVNRGAKKLLDRSKMKLENLRYQSGKALEDLGKEKVEVLDKSVMRFIGNFEKLKNVEIEETAGINEINKFKIDKQALTQLKEMGGFAASVLTGVAGGALGGALTAFGAYGLAATFGTAGTGTAIATLSGVAASNATLAFLGGGTLAAGGAGMAGGMAVLGGLVAGPALLITGITMSVKAGENLDNAYSNMAEAKKIAAELDAAGVVCEAISRRANMFSAFLKALDNIFVPLIERMEEIIESCGENYEKFSKDDKNTICEGVSTLQAIKSILDTPILTEDGKLTEESKKLLGNLNDFLGTFIAKDVEDCLESIENCLEISKNLKNCLESIEKSIENCLESKK